MIETLCWTCQNAFGGCNWSKNLEPVEGWTVKETVRTEARKPIPGVLVLSCPKYIQDRRAI